MLPQNLVCKYELNCEYCNITLAGTKLPDDDLTRSKHVGVFESVLKCFKIVLYEIMCAFVSWQIEMIPSHVLLSKKWIANVNFVRSDGGRATMDTQATMQRNETIVVIVVVVYSVLYFG